MGKHQTDSLCLISKWSSVLQLISALLKATYFSLLGCFPWQATYDSGISILGDSRAVQVHIHNLMLWHLWALTQSWFHWLSLTPEGDSATPFIFCWLWSIQVLLLAGAKESFLQLRLYQLSVVDGFLHCLYFWKYLFTSWKLSRWGLDLRYPLPICI